MWPDDTWVCAVLLLPFLMFKCRVKMTIKFTEAVFLYCYPHWASCLTHLNSIGWATWAIWAAKQKYSLNYPVKGSLKVKYSRFSLILSQKFTKSHDHGCALRPGLMPHVKRHMWQWEVKHLTIWSSFNAVEMVITVWLVMGRSTLACRRPFHVISL